LAVSLTKQLRKELADIVGEENVSDTISSPGPCNIVYLPGKEQHKPSLAVWPSTEEEISRILRLANSAGISVITWGGGTDRYSGGIVVPKGALVVTTQRMNKIVHIDKDTLSVTAQSGITVEQLNKQLTKSNLWWPHDPESKQYATLGGCISVSGIGTYATTLGSATDSVLGLRVVLPDGEVIKLGSHVKQSATGYDLMDLFTRAEGTLGIITEVTVRVRQIPEARHYDVIRFGDVRAAVDAAQRILDSGMAPETLIIEDFTRFYNTITGIDVGQDALVRSSMKDDKAVAIVSFSGSNELVAFSRLQSVNLCKKFGGTLIDDRRVPEAWWKAKTEYPPQIPTDAMIKQIPVVEGIADIAVPLQYFPEIHEEFVLSLQGKGFFSYGARCYVNPYRDALISMVVAFDESKQEEVAKFTRWVTELSKLALNYGGTMEAITGSGLKLVDDVQHELAESLRVAKTLKRTLDPNNIMNPGKKFHA